MSIYNADGVKILDRLDTFIDNMNIDYEFDSPSDANYTILRIYQTKIDGTKQYPFVYSPNGIDGATDSTLSMNRRDKWPFAINAGIFDTSGGKVPLGLLIQNGVILQRGPAGTVTERRPLTIDSNGNLGCVLDNADADELIANGCVSAVCGFGSIIEDYQAIDVSYIPNYLEQAQRQIIGQFGNGDYAILTCEGRSWDNSDGWTMAEAQAVCQKHGLKFAYNLDGGGSTETVIGQRQVNAIYDGTTGRIVPTYIVFNGTNVFGKVV